jgi:hypothetical protein
VKFEGHYLIKYTFQIRDIIKVFIGTTYVLLTEQLTRQAAFHCQWTRHWDPKSNKGYWDHPDTGSQWEDPEAHAL